MPRAARASKSPVPPPVRRSSRQSTPVRDLASPPPVHNNSTVPASASRATRASAAGLSSHGSAPSLAPPVPDTAAGTGGVTSSPGRGPRKSTTTRALSPRVAARVVRPPLPAHAVNEQMVEDGGARAGGKPPKLHKVKTQTLHLGDDNGTIMIARVKCPVPKNVPGHIIKRFDTNAVSASSLFRAAFPTATAEEEATEMRWIVVGSRGIYGDTVAAGMEHLESRKLSGTWIPAVHAHTLATEYGIIRYARDLIDFAEPANAGSSHGTPSAVTVGPAADDFDDSPAVRSPKSKRARVSSPLANKTAAPQALSGASGPGVSILQTLETSKETGDMTETTEVKVDVPVSEPQTGADAVPAFDEAGAQQLAEARQLVESLKQSGTLSDLTEATDIPGGSHKKKRSLELDADDEDELPAEGTLADAIGTVDNRSFWGKLFRRNRRKPTQASRETKTLPAPRATTQQEIPQVVVRDEDAETEGRRWTAGLGLAVAVGATAAAPYLFG